MNRGITSRYNQEMIQQTDMPNGVGGVGFEVDYIDDLVAGALVQQRLLSVSGREVHKEDIQSIFSAAGVD